VSNAAAFLAYFLPHLESPLPEKIGIGFPLSTAGAGALLVGIVHTASPPEKRDRAIRVGGLVGFMVGAAFYLFVLVIQVFF
jgi:hypothetical protein